MNQNIKIIRWKKPQPYDYNELQTKNIGRISQKQLIFDKSNKISMKN